MINIPDTETTTVPVCNDQGQIVRQPYNTVPALDLNPVGPEAVEDGYNGMKDPVIRLSQNMKLAMRHVGFKEHAVEVDEEWKWVESEGTDEEGHTWKGKIAVPPTGRDPQEKYTEEDPKKYTKYGATEYQPAEPFIEDPAAEVSETFVVTEEAEAESNDDPDMVEALPVLAVNREQGHLAQREGRHGEIDTDPVDNENYLTRPGMEVKTSETWIYIRDNAESESGESGPVEPESTKYTVTLNKNGGEFADGSSDVTEYTSGTETQLPTMTKEGSNFLGWGTEDGKDYWTSIPSTATGNLTLTAQFEEARKAVTAKRTYTKKTTAESTSEVTL